MLEAAGPTHHVWHTGDGSTLDVGREGRQTIGHAWLVRQLRIHSCSSHLLPSSLTERLPKGTSVTCHSHLEKNEWMKWLEFSWFQREIKKKNPNKNICQISVFAFTETKFQFKFLNIKLSVLNSQFHNFYQVKIYPKRMFYKYIQLCGAEVLQFNLHKENTELSFPIRTDRNYFLQHYRNSGRPNKLQILWYFVHSEHKAWLCTQTDGKGGEYTEASSKWLSTYVLVLEEKCLSKKMSKTDGLDKWHPENSSRLENTNRTLPEWLERTLYIQRATWPAGVSPMVKSPLLEP